MASTAELQAVDGAEYGSVHSPWMAEIKGAFEVTDEASSCVDCGSLVMLLLFLPFGHSSPWPPNNNTVVPALVDLSRVARYQWKADD